MYGRKLVNGSVECLGVPRFLCNDGHPWTDNILVPSPRWGVGGTFETWALESQPGGCYIGCYGGVDVPWRGAVPDRATYLPWSLEMRAPLRTVSMKISLRNTVWRAPKVSQIPGTPSAMSWLIGQIASWMIFGTNRIFNKFCGNFMVVV